MTEKVVAAAVLMVILAACSSVQTEPRPEHDSPVGTTPAITAPTDEALARYRCDHNIDFTVRFDNGAAMIDMGPRGNQTLLRDAGGVTPQQTVYSSTTLRAEFGLEPEGRGARLNYLSPAMGVNCVRE